MAIVYCQPDGTVVCGLHGVLSAPDPAWIALTVSALPRNLAVVRWDGKDGLRDETEAERNARLDTEKADRIRQRLAETEAADALTTIVARKLGLDPTTLRQEVLTEMAQTTTRTVTRG